MIEGEQSTPSLLRAFLYEDAFPVKNDFFSWVLDHMRQEVRTAFQNDFLEAWSNRLGSLVHIWDMHFPNTPFIADIFRVYPKVMKEY